MAKHRRIRTLEEAEELADLSTGEYASFAASLLIQGTHRFYTLSMPSDVLAETCTVDRRSENPVDGFQRFLDKKRAQEIADYIDAGFGTIPTSIVLSAQDTAQMKYSSAKRTLRFRRVPGAFLILDGQHRVYGFHKAETRVRVPVVIYNNLSRADECQLFMDINTKQRPVPSELLLDIKQLADAETDAEAILRDIFDYFAKDTSSPLFGLMSPAERRRGKISRVTFNAAMKPIWGAFVGSDAKHAYKVLAAYLHSCLAGLRARNAEDKITNPTLFRALMSLFPQVAERVSDRHGNDYTSANFSEIITPFFRRIKMADLNKPGTSYIILYENFRKSLRSGFSIGAGAVA
jgi:DGQHR domain-containing protein